MSSSAVTSDLIVLHVHVNRDRSPEEALKATGRQQYVTASVVAEMLRGTGVEADVCFFKLGRWLYDADLEKEYELRGLVPADPYCLAAVNEANPSFAENHPNATHWQDVTGQWCIAAFYRWNGECGVKVQCGGGEWPSHWWFAGIRK